LGGTSFDESFRLEPAQLAGFNQSFRTIISESLVGSVSTPAYQIAGGALDIKLGSRTYLGLEADFLDSDAPQVVGIFSKFGGFPLPPNPNAFPTNTPEHLHYQERSITASVNQLVSEQWAVGAQYRFTRSELEDIYPEASKSSSTAAELQQASLFAQFNHPSGFFARAEGHWFHQHNFGYTLPALPTSDFFQCNFFIGWRSPRNRFELSVGGLNLNDSDYHLNPLNLYPELPRERVGVVRVRINL
jgi:hypothetical protein